MDGDQDGGRWERSDLNDYLEQERIQREAEHRQAEFDDQQQVYRGRPVTFDQPQDESVSYQSSMTEGYPGGSTGWQPQPLNHAYEFGSPYAPPHHANSTPHSQQDPSAFMATDEQPALRSPSTSQARPPGRSSTTSTTRTSFSASHDTGSKSKGSSGGPGTASTSKEIVDEGEEGLDGKKKRKRVERACYNCRQKRSKCDGLQPCALCVHNKIECSYPPPTRKVTIKYVEELEAKLAALDGSNPRSVDSHETASAPSGSGPKNLITTFPHSPPRPTIPLSHSHSPKNGLGLRSNSDQNNLARPSHALRRPSSDPLRPYYSLPQPSIAPPNMQLDGINSKSQHDPQRMYSGQYGGPLNDQMAHQGGSSQIGPYPHYEQHPSPGTIVEPPYRPWHFPDASSEMAPSYPAPPPQPPSSFQNTDRRQPPPTRQHEPPPTQRESVHAAFSPGADTSSSLGDVDESDHRRMMGDLSKWERQGRDGRNTELLERSVARLTGEGVKPSSIKLGAPIDDFVTQSLAPAASFEEMYILPDPALADELLQFYQDRIHWLFPIIHLPTVKRRYKQISELSDRNDHQYSTKEQIDLATVNLIFAITCAIRCGATDAPFIGQFFKRSQALMSGSTVLLLANVPVINYLSLLSMFSQSCSKGNLSSNATGLALSMSRGLQLENPKVNKTFDPFSKLLRQRAWAGCLVMEPTSSVMLYRMTTTLESDFDDLCLPDAVDDDDVLEDGTLKDRDPSEPRQIDYFIHLCKLMSVKASILRDVYKLEQRPTFPDAHAVLRLEELLFVWEKNLPAHLEETSASGPFREQAKRLKLRYANVRVLLYRPFLFHFCTTPGGSYPVPNSLKFELARKSAHVCQQAAVEVLESITDQWNREWAGWWWWKLAYIYCASLAILAHRIMNATYPESEISYYERQSVDALDKALDVLHILGWKAEAGVDTTDEAPRRITPPKSFVATARRCYRIISSIHKSIKLVSSTESKTEADAVAAEANPKAAATQTTAVPPGRYSRNPDHSLPPLRLPKSSPTFSDDNFIQNWVNLMPPSLRSETFVPPDFVAPATPFDMSVRQENPAAPINDSAWQDWASLLGSGYLSNLGVSTADTNDAEGGVDANGGIFNLTSVVPGLGGLGAGPGDSLMGDLWASTSNDHGHIGQDGLDGMADLEGGGEAGADVAAPVQGLPMDEDAPPSLPL